MLGMADQMWSQLSGMNVVRLLPLLFFPFSKSNFDENANINLPTSRWSFSFFFSSSCLRCHTFLKNTTMLLLLLFFSSLGSNQHSPHTFICTTLWMCPRAPG
jgi:hypothetical protein